MSWAFRGRDEPHSISEVCVKAAIDLFNDYFVPHGFAALRLIGSTDKHADARRVLHWIRDHAITTISRELVRKDILGRKLDAQDTSALITELEKIGWLRKLPPTDQPEVGRPRVRWQVHLGGITANTGKSHGYPVE